ncbi:MAG: M15 family metallopeptidase [Candidatus Scalindua sp.]
MNIAISQKIPSLNDIKGWENVEIHKCNERLISLNDLYPERILIKPQYFLKGIEGSLEECYVRDSVAKILIKASKLLPGGRKFVVLDAWRPIEVQKIIFNKYKESLERDSPNTNERKLIDLTRKYVSLPSANEDNPSPHSTGGAIDLSLLDSSGNYLNMGTSFDDFNEKSNTRYYEQLIETGKKLSDKEFIILNNRRLLFHIMNKVGFTNYSEEWWHYDYGDQLRGKLKDTVYGEISSQN